MSSLVVIAYPGENKASEAVATLSRLQTEQLINLEDLAWVTKNAKGKMKLHQGTSLAAAGASGGALWGMIFGLLFFAPWLGMAIGAAAGGLAGKMSDIGIDDKWIKDVAEAIPDNGSAVFIMARNANTERVIPEMAKLGGTVIRTNLSEEQEKALIEAISHPA